MKDLERKVTEELHDLLKELLQERKKTRKMQQNYPMEEQEGKCLCTLQDLKVVVS